jgi:hypothetical protein
MATKTPHEWSSEALLTKAQRYAERMLEQSRDDWQFGFWSVLCLEMILRAALAHTSQVLLADAKNWKNTLYALGKSERVDELSPKSIDSNEVISRTAELYPKFTRELANFCVLHLQRRNSELHSGLLPFDGLNTSGWLPQFYAASEALLSAQGASLTDVFGQDEAAAAQTQVQALRDDAAKSVKGTINAHKTIWEEKPPDERKKLAKQAEDRSTRADGHRVRCPSCASVALVHGTPTGSTLSDYKDGVIVLRQSKLPSHFECKACDLKIVGYSKLNACGLGGSFTSTSTADPIDYFEADVLDRFAGMAEDNNEP